jgi:hypothetical protein
VIVDDDHPLDGVPVGVGSRASAVVHRGGAQRTFHRRERLNDILDPNIDHNISTTVGVQALEVVVRVTHGKSSVRAASPSGRVVTPESWSAAREAMAQATAATFLGVWSSLEGSLTHAGSASP